MLVAIVLFVPETYHPVLLRRKARNIRKERRVTGQQYLAPIERIEKSILHTVMWSIVRPFQLLTLEPMCLNLCIFSAVLREHSCKQFFVFCAVI